MIRIVDLHLTRADLKTRMPFRYGIATMTQVPHVFAHVQLETAGQVQAGIAADHLPPKWFTKNPSGDVQQEIEEMLRVIHHAMTFARSIAAPTVFAFWQELYRQQSAWATSEKIPALLANFGTSLVERAVIDATARRIGVSLHQLLQRNDLGIDLGAIDAALKGSAPSTWLPASPRHRVFARHTVGLTDPLTDAEILPAEKVDDGLPQSLVACIRAYGLRHFKIKVSGGTKQNLDRLEAVAEVLAQHAPADYRHSIDGNEGFIEANEFRSFITEANSRPCLTEFFRHLMFVEQPFHREVALSARTSLMDWKNRPPVIIDESDADLHSLPTALELGYVGTTHKNCKGVFKGIINACRIAHRNQTQPSRKLLLSGEDLSTIGPVSLLQDLAVQAALGIASVERNGHHYFAGLSFWPTELQNDLLAAHPDLFHRSPHGWPTLKVDDGEINLSSVNAAPFGVSLLPILGTQI